MKVITVASDLENVAFNNFLSPSCTFYKLDATVLEFEGVFGSNRLKDALLNAYLEHIADDELVLFTDATDTVFVANEDEICHKFSQFKAPLVFSAEINCWPDRELENGYPVSNEHFNYLNSGGFIGRAGFLKEIYQKYPIFETANEPGFLWSNQYYWNTVYKIEHEFIKIDHQCQIFYNTAIPLTDFALHKRQVKDNTMFNHMICTEQDRLNKEIRFIDGRMESILTGSLPCHIHFPGVVSKQLMIKGFFDSLKPPQTILAQ